MFDFLNLLHALALEATLLMVSFTPVGAQERERRFQRAASFYPFLNTDIELISVAEIVSATPDGNTLVYPDSETKTVGFVDIHDPANPLSLGFTDVDVSLTR